MNFRHVKALVDLSQFDVDGEPRPKSMLLRVMFVNGQASVRVPRKAEFGLTPDNTVLMALGEQDGNIVFLAVHSICAIELVAS